ncbi:hypothetical protein DQQ10_15720 [Pseudochryseolinea flava]|uniref:Uncharacterized protein n=1 Tax=Pseudochryseolinea flava TaxID=2059302 RepID=A0A364Y030_9BACT|nr:hypothetical protein DQQ10_15720 [Pseudochryseolinea flava]
MIVAKKIPDFSSLLETTFEQMILTVHRRKVASGVLKIFSLHHFQKNKYQHTRNEAYRETFLLKIFSNNHFFKNLYA